MACGGTLNEMEQERIFVDLFLFFFVEKRNESGFWRKRGAFS